MEWRNPENRDHNKEIEIASLNSGRILKGVYRHIKNSPMFSLWIGEDNSTKEFNGSQENGFLLPRREWVVID